MSELADYLNVLVTATGLGFVHWRWSKGRKKADQNMEQLEKRLDSKVKKANGVPWAFIDNLPLPAWAKDLEGKMIWINAEYSLQFGIKATEYEGRTDYDIWPFHIAEKFRKHDLEVARSGLTMKFEEEAPETWDDPEAKVLTWHVQKFPIFGHDGKITAIGGVASLADK